MKPRDSIATISSGRWRTATSDQQIDGFAHRRAVAHQRRQVAEQDPRLGEIGHVAHARPQQRAPRVAVGAGAHEDGPFDCRVSSGRNPIGFLGNLAGAHLEMQVGTGRAAALADQRDAIAGAHRLALCHQQHGVVRIDREQVAGVPDHDQVAVAADAFARVLHPSVGGREHRGADRRGQIDAFVGAPLARSEGRGDDDPPGRERPAQRRARDGERWRCPLRDGRRRRRRLARRSEDEDQSPGAGVGRVGEAVDLQEIVHRHVGAAGDRRQVLTRRDHVPASRRALRVQRRLARPMASGGAPNRNERGQRQAAADTHARPPVDRRARRSGPADRRSGSACHRRWSNGRLGGARPPVLVLPARPPGSPAGPRPPAPTTSMAGMRGAPAETMMTS